ncbi:MAG: alpha-L-fucosidase [Phycisphaerales bacterium JB038]
MSRRSCNPVLPALALLLALVTIAQPAPGQADDDDRMDWWREARFGLFIHWGLYAIPAGEWGDENRYGEWIMTNARIPVEEYEKFVPRFNPVEFDADAWVRAAKGAGMKYIVITSKHHDGFCLFDSEFTDYDVMSTPFQRDIMRELADACEEHGLKMCWYHSIMDWHHPDYLPRRGWETRPSEGADFERYVEYMRGQVTELLTNYGEIGVMWFDGQWEGTWTHAHGKPLYDLCRELQPSVIVNDRVDKGRKGHSGVVDSEYAGDFGTPEQHIPATGLPGVDWETCMTMNRHWGYNRADDEWKSSEDLIRKLIDIASKNGNYLLNVGPKADGTFPEACLERLEAIGAWMQVNGESIYGTTASPFAELPFDGRCTVKRIGSDTRLYLHIFDWPERGRLRLAGLGNEVIEARLLADPKETVPVMRNGADLQFGLPEEALDEVATVLTLDVVGRPIVYDKPTIEAESPIFVRSTRVRLKTDSPDLVLRYTLDGSTPTGASRLYRRPIRVAATTTIKARAFHAGRAVSDTAELTVDSVTPTPALGIAEKELSLGLRCETYLGDWDEVPDFAALQPRQETVVETVRLIGDPAAEYLARRYSGLVFAPQDDVYEFVLSSDDGSRLLIAGREVVDNDGLHGPEAKAGRIALARGWHPIRVQWFNKSGGATLKLRWRRGAADLVEVPASAFKHRAD